MKLTLSQLEEWIEQLSNGNKKRVLANENETKFYFYLKVLESNWAFSFNRNYK